MVEAVIFGYVFFGVLAVLIVKLWWGDKPEYPAGNRCDYNYNEFKSVLIVDQDIKMEDGCFIVGDNKINQISLARICAMSMEAVDNTIKIYGPEHLRKKHKLTSCVFVFLSEDKFYKKMNSSYNVSPRAAGFADILSKNMGAKAGPYVCYMDIKYINDVMTAGSLTIHEYTHCFSHHITKNWDAYHNIWKFKAINGSSIQKIAVNRIKNQLELDKKLQT